MIEAATDVLIARSRVQETWSPVVLASVAAHAAAVAALLFMPAADFSDDAPKTVMTISLGGAPGPRAGGMSPIGGRTVQEVAPPEAAPTRAEAPPATKAPEMTLPSKDARPRQETKTAAAAKEAVGKTTTKGAEVQEGSARADTGGRGQGFGLSGGGGTGGGVTLDVGNFCCPEYLERMVQVIQRNWVSKQNLVGRTGMKFTIDRNGTLRDVQVERPSGFTPLDLAAQRALLVTARVPELPATFPNQSLTVHMNFEYQR